MRQFKQPIHDQKLLTCIEKSIHQVLISNNYILGKQVVLFEKRFAGFIGVPYAIGVGTGTDALRLSLRVLGIGKGDKVLTTAFTSSFTILAIVEEGATPVFLDIDEETWTINPEEIGRNIDKKTRAIIPVHIYGNPCHMPEIIRFTKISRLKIIEDACQAHGAHINGKMIGSWGDLATFSFYPTKNLGGAGDGGIITTHSGKLSTQLTYLRNGGQTQRFLHRVRGVNSRLDELQAAILSVKMALLRKQNIKRRQLAKRYREHLSNLPLTFQKTISGGYHVYHQFVIRTSKRDALKKFLQTKGIMTDIHYPLTADAQPIFKVYKTGTLKKTKLVAREILSLPMFPDLSEKNQDYIIQKIRAFFV